MNVKIEPQSNVNVKIEPQSPTPPTPPTIRISPAPAPTVPVSSTLRRLGRRLGSHNSPGTQESTNRPRRVSKKPATLNYDVLGGMASTTTSTPVITDLQVHHVTNYFAAYFASYGSSYDQTATFEAEITPETLSCLASLDELSPHHFAQVFQAAKKKNPDILSYDEAMRDFSKLKDWLAAAMKEIAQLEEKECWI